MSEFDPTPLPAPYGMMDYRKPAERAACAGTRGGGGSAVPARTCGSCRHFHQPICEGIGYCDCNPKEMCYATDSCDYYYGKLT